MNPDPRVSVVIPCRNEEAFVSLCLDSIVRNDYPKDRLEVLVIDGMSADRTRDILGKYTSRLPFVRMLDNPGKEQQLALNIGITAAVGEIIIRMDAHSTYKENYISECVKALQSYPADNVGGRWVTVPRQNILLGRAICFATSVPFGVGNAYYRLMSLNSSAPALNTPTWEINVAYFCCRREIFADIGLFNEKLDRSEDIDFRARLKKGGYRTLFVPTIECYYSMRTGLWSFLRHMFRNGLWVLLPLNHAPNISFSLRHIVPLLFILSILGTGAGSFVFPAVHWFFGLITGSYAVANAYYSFRIARREKNIAFLFVLPPIFLGLHMAYGLGSLVALVYLGAHWIRKQFGNPCTKNSFEKTSIAT